MNKLKIYGEQLTGTELKSIYAGTAPYAGPGDSGVCTCADGRQYTQVNCESNECNFWCVTGSNVCVG